MALDKNIKGLDGVIRKLKSLPVNLQKKSLRRAVSKGAQLVKRAAVTNAKRFDNPITPAKIYKEIVVRNNTKLGKQVGGVALQVGVRGGAKKYVNNKQNRRLGRVGAGYEGAGNLYYWRFLEFGTQKMPARRFMTSALESNADAATSAIVQELNSEIDKLVK